MPKRKGIIYATLERLHHLTTLKESRYQAKAARRASGERIWAFSTGKIHSLTTRGVYQQHILAFINWVRGTHHLTHLEQVDARADELVTAYLAQHLAAGRSPYTLQTERAALRLFFSDRHLATALALPPRAREQIRRSRGPVAQDQEIQLRNWQCEIAFLQACGLRRAEALALHVQDIQTLPDGHIVVHVRRGKGGRSREVPVLPGHEQEVLAIVAGRGPEERAIERLPVRLDVHSFRRAYAQALYLSYAPGRTLPPPHGRLKPSDYDEAAARLTSEALGHSRLSVALTHYLR